MKTWNQIVLDNFIIRMSLCDLFELSETFRTIKTQETKKISPGKLKPEIILYGWKSIEFFFSQKFEIE